MVNIMLACASGMSTSIIVRKMEEVAEEKGIDANIWAVGQDQVPTELEKADVVLIGPQLRFMKKKYTDKAKDLDVAVDSIDPMPYGRNDGEAILQMALDLIND